MTVTFLVALEVSDLTALPAIAGDIEDDLIQAGHDVSSVKPWARPSGNPLAALPSMLTTPTTQTTQEPQIEIQP